MRIPSEAIAALKEFGYTAREAEFLYIVAAHSGFFLQRQFMQFVDVGGRGPATYFLKKAIQNKHVREYLPERGNQKIYHLFSRTVYDVIEKGNSRNRRPGRYGLLEKAAVRMLGLDFVLAHLGFQYLEGETDKVGYFTLDQKLSADLLPGKLYSGEGGRKTQRYFVEGFPMFLSGGGSKLLISFTYVEDEIRSLQTFTSFLNRYQPLFEALERNFKLIFVSNSTRSFNDARKTFAKVLCASKYRDTETRPERYFWLRHMAEEKRFNELTHRDVVEWQRGVKQYADAQYETQYREWLQSKKTAEIKNGIGVHINESQFETFLPLPNVRRFGPQAVGDAAQSTAQLQLRTKPP